MTAIVPYTSTDIVRERVYEVLPPPEDILRKGCLVTQGGTNTDADTLTTGIADFAELQTILADSKQLSSIQHYYLSFGALVGKQATVSALSSITKTNTSAAYATGTVTMVTSTTHGLPVGETIPVLVSGITPAEYNGVQIVTVVDTTTLTFPDVDHGAITTDGSISVITGTATAHGFPLNSILSGNVVGVTPSSLTGEYRIGFTDANTFYYAHAHVTATIALVDAVIRIAEATITGHGLTQNVPMQARVDGVSLAAYNGVKNIVATDANTIYFPANDSNLVPVYGAGHVSVVLATTSAAHGFEVGAATDVTLSGNVPEQFNGAYSGSVLTANIVAYVPDYLYYIGEASTIGKILDTGAAELYAMGKSFFDQGQNLRLNVLELGNDTIANGINQLAAFIVDNEWMLHAYCLPRNWDVTQFANVCQNFNTLENFPVFFVPTNLTNSGLFKGNYRVACTIDSNSASKSANEYLAAAFMYRFLAPVPSLSVPYSQLQYQYLIGFTPYEFVSSTDPNIAAFKRANVTYVADTAEGGTSHVMLMGAYSMASDSELKPIDLSAIWAVDYVRVKGDQRMAQRIIDSSNDPTKRLNLNETDGVQCVADLRATLQTFLDETAAVGIIEKQSTQNGKLTKVTAFAEDFWQWKEQNQLSYAAKDYTGLSTIISVRKGITNLKIAIGVQFIA